MHISLDINDSKAHQFLAFLKTLDFVKINESETDFEIPESHKPILDKRLEEYYSKPNRVKDFKKNLAEIRKSL